MPIGLLRRECKSETWMSQVMFGLSRGNWTWLLVTNKYKLQLRAMPHHCRAHQSWYKGKQRRARLSDRPDQSKIDPSRERCPQSLQLATPTVQGQSLWSKCIDGPGSIGLIANCIKSSSSLDDEGINPIKMKVSAAFCTIGFSTCGWVSSTLLGEATVEPATWACCWTVDSLSDDEGCNN